MGVVCGMWEVGLFGHKNVESGTFKTMCHPHHAHIYMLQLQNKTIKEPKCKKDNYNHTSSS